MEVEPTDTPVVKRTRGGDWERRLFVDLGLASPERGLDWGCGDHKSEFKYFLGQAINLAIQKGLDMSGRKSWNELRNDFTAMHEGITAMISFLNTNLRYAGILLLELIISRLDQNPTGPKVTKAICEKLLQRRLKSGQKEARRSESMSRSRPTASTASSSNLEPEFRSGFFFNPDFRLEHTTVHNYPGPVFYPPSGAVEPPGCSTGENLDYDPSIIDMGDLTPSISTTLHLSQISPGYDSGASGQTPLVAESRVLDSLTNDKVLISWLRI
jgi:hypothetical protein